MDEMTAKAGAPPTHANRLRAAERNLSDHEYSIGVTIDTLKAICRELDMPIPEFRRPPSPEPTVEPRRY